MLNRTLSEPLSTHPAPAAPADVPLSRMATTEYLYGSAAQSSSRAEQPPSPVLSDSESSLKHFLRDHFSQQEEANARTTADLSHRLSEMTTTLENLKSTMEHVEGTLQRVETTLQKSFELQTELFTFQRSSIMRQEEIQSGILSLLKKLAVTSDSE